MKNNLLKNIFFLSSFTLLSSYSFSQAGGELTGTTVTGIHGITKTAGDVMKEVGLSRVPDHVIIPVRPEPKAPEPTMQNPEAKPVSRYGTLVGSTTSTGPTTSTSTTQATTSNFLAIWGSYATVAGRESPYTPPDNNGDVGATQLIVTANCRMKIFTKPSVNGPAAATPTGSSTQTSDAVINLDLNAFFANASLGISGISDPHVRYDRLSGRWFIVAIDINHNTNNYCCVAVSPTGTLDANSKFDIFYFNISQTGGSSQDFYDYPTLGVDKNYLYIGGNMFKSGRTFSGCNIWVVNKASLISGSLTVTSFPHAKTNTNMYTPQGVQNDDPAANSGYFIGASQTVYSKLVLKRVNYVTSGAPTLSADISITTPTTYTPKTVPTLGGTAIDGGDRRLFAAMIKKNKISGSANLWVAQGTLLNSSGIGGSTGDRDGALWMEIGNLSSTTPAIVQSATMYDGVNAASSAVNYTYPTIALSGQGHNIMGFTSAGAAKYAQAGVAGRYRSDAVATLQSPVDLTNTTSTYNPGANRWGDYTQTVVDPTDDMTMWTFTEYVATKDAWGVRAAQLKAPAPATPSIDANTPVGCGTTHVIINGTSTNNSEFFDPGADDPASVIKYNHLNVTVNDPTVTVANIKFVNPTQITADFTIANASSGQTYTVTVTNPDGQTASTTFKLATGCINSAPATSITSTTSAVAPESFTTQNTAIANLYPNPTSSMVMVNVTSKEQQKATLEVFDFTGRKVKAEPMILVPGINQKQLSFADFVSGIYIVQIKDSHNVIQKVKVIKN
ncbi:MAG: T9SS type A sorting domain-containing protein [Bacteroidota bacterium]|nr:T9SS type A sorting domain-containing protein [Bacteroidota bacterium]